MVRDYAWARINGEEENLRDQFLLHQMLVWYKFWLICFLRWEKVVVYLNAWQFKMIIRLFPSWLRKYVKRIQIHSNQIFICEIHQKQRSKSDVSESDDRRDRTKLTLVYSLFWLRQELKVSQCPYVRPLAQYALKQSIFIFVGQRAIREH